MNYKINNNQFNPQQAEAYCIKLGYSILVEYNCAFEQSSDIWESCKEFQVPFSRSEDNLSIIASIINLPFVADNVENILINGLPVYLANSGKKWALIDSNYDVIGGDEIIKHRAVQWELIESIRMEDLK